MKPSNAKTQKSTVSASSPSVILMVILSFTWMLAVVKVFLLEGHHSISHTSEEVAPALIEIASKDLFARSEHETNPTLLKGGDYTGKTFVRNLDTDKRELINKAASIVVPTSSEWAFIRASPDYKVSGNRVHLLPNGREEKEGKKHFPEDATVKKASDLTWPPVQKDGTISASDGVEIMPIVGLKVPRFFMPPPEFDMNKVGSKVNGQETIFLMIASYRDPQCRETITTAYSRADYPERLFIGAVDQLAEGDIGCVDLDVDCSVDPSQMICKYRDQISVFNMEATYSTGPVTGKCSVLFISVAGC
jgi:hypothetical protein